MKVSGLHSILLYVQDLEQAMHFYQSQLGLMQLSKDESTIVLRAGKCNLVLHRADKADWPDPKLRPEPGGHAVSFEVEDPDAWAVGLRGQGIEILEGPLDQVWGRVVFVRDPDGRLVSLVRPLFTRAAPTPLSPADT